MAKNALKGKTVVSWKWQTWIKSLGFSLLKTGSHCQWRGLELKIRLGWPQTCCNEGVGLQVPVGLLAWSTMPMLLFMYSNSISGAWRCVLWHRTYLAFPSSSTLEKGREGNCGGGHSRVSWTPALPREYRAHTETTKVTISPCFPDSLNTRVLLIHYLNCSSLTLRPALSLPVSNACLFYLSYCLPTPWGRNPDYNWLRNTLYCKKAAFTGTPPNNENWLVS